MRGGFKRDLRRWRRRSRVGRSARLLLPVAIVGLLASIAAPRSHRRTASSEKAEKVVNPPSTPTPRKSFAGCASPSPASTSPSTASVRRSR